MTKKQRKLKVSELAELIIKRKTDAGLSVTPSQAVLLAESYYHTHPNGPNQYLGKTLEKEVDKIIKSNDFGGNQ